MEFLSCLKEKGCTIEWYLYNLINLYYHGQRYSDFGIDFCHEVPGLNTAGHCISSWGVI